MSINCHSIKAAKFCFAALVVVGIGIMVYGLVVVPLLPYVQADVVLTPAELRDPASVAAMLATLKKAGGNLWLFVTGAGLIVTLFSSLGFLAVCGKPIHDSVDEQGTPVLLISESSHLRLRHRVLLVRLLLVLVCLGCAVGCGLWVLTSSDRIRVAVHNAGPEALHNVIVHVTGNHYDMGDIEVKELKVVRVTPTSESGVELEFKDANNLRHRVVADSYFEPGYRGTITINLKNSSIIGIDSTVKPSLF